MPEGIDWRRVEKARPFARTIVAQLRRGAVVIAPSETNYLALVLAQHAEAFQRVGAWKLPLEVLVGPGAARDWFPDLSFAAQRLLKRCWPGPVTIANATSLERGLLGCLPSSARSALHRDQRLSLRRPRHAAIQHILEHSPEPILAGPIEAFHMRQVVERIGDGFDLFIDDGATEFGCGNTSVELKEQTWQVSREGAITTEQLTHQAAELILFVCTGNTCRSPMAEAICKKLLSDRLGCGMEELAKRGWVVASSGMAASRGMPAASEAREVVRTLGGDLSKHESQPLTYELVTRADHLWVMTSGHLEALEAQLPAGVAQPELLSVRGEEIGDPVGQSLAVYQACAKQMSACIEERLGRLLG
jgi:protein-tyrosine phosphatase